MTLLSLGGLVVFLGGLFGLAGHGIWRAITTDTESATDTDSAADTESDRFAACRWTAPTAEVPDTVPPAWVMAYRAEQDG